VPAGSFAGALRSAVLQGRRQMVYHMTQNDDVQTMEPGIMAGILGTAIYHRRCVRVCEGACSWAVADTDFSWRSLAGPLLQRDSCHRVFDHPR
jgi:hypothetical protein